MTKLCFGCGKHTYIRLRLDGSLGVVCEGCQRGAIELAVELSELENSLKIIEKVIDSY